MSVYTQPGSVIAVGVVFPIFATIAVVLRFWARRAQKAPLLIDDWLIVWALLNNIGLGMCIVIGVAKHAFAYHTPPPDSDEPDAYLYFESPEHRLSSQNMILIILGLTQLIYALQPLGTFAFGCTKLSIVYFYRRIFCTNYASSFLNKATWGMIIFLYVWIVAFLFGFIFDCGLEFWSNWGPLINNSGYCKSTYGLTATFTISDVVTDLIVICLPIQAIWKLQMSLGQKIAITCIFLLGALTIITCALRLILFAIWYFEGNEILHDINIIYTEMIFWVTITASLGIITACLPTIQVLVRRFSTGFLRSNLSSFRSSFWKPSASRSWFRFGSNSTESVLPRSQSQVDGLEYSQFQMQGLSQQKSSKTVQ